MSFVIVTDVFCDRCPHWMGDEGGVSSNRIQKREAWSKAVHFGWKKIGKRHVCPRCLVKMATGARKNLRRLGIQ